MKRKAKKSSIIYIRCRFCGKAFKGSSDDIMERYSKHFASCKNKQKESQTSKTVSSSSK